MPRDLVLPGADVLVLQVLGAARGASVTVSERDGGAFQKGTKWTLVLWIAADETLPWSRSISPMCCPST
ncbi:MAG: hypothetical protein ABW215_19820 [Kibdelosporangium sp.]